MGILLTVYGSALWAGPCTDAILETQNSEAEFADRKVFPVVCNWNYIAALEREMLVRGDADHPRTIAQYHDQIESEFVKRAQRRVGLTETGVVDFELFLAYVAGL